MRNADTPRPRVRWRGSDGKHRVKTFRTAAEAARFEASAPGASSPSRPRRAPRHAATSPRLTPAPAADRPASSFLRELMSPWLT